MKSALGWDTYTLRPVNWGVVYHKSIDIIYIVYQGNYIEEVQSEQTGFREG